MTLNNKLSKLPFIIFPEYNLRILLDTGSTTSFINPDVAEKYFKNKIVSDPFQISSAHGSSNGKFSTSFRCPKIFKRHRS